MPKQGSRPNTIPAEMLDLVGDIYQASMDSSRWAKVVSGVCSLIGADVGHLFTPAEGLKDRFLHACHNLPEEALLQYSNYYWQHDVWREKAFERGDIYQGLIQRGEELISPKDFRQTEFFNDHLKQGGIESLLVNILFDESASEIAPRTHLSLMRRPGREGFSEHEVALMRLLMPHLQRALAFHWQLAKGHLHQKAHEQAIENLGYGVVLLDRNQKVVYLNSLAQRIMDSTQALTIKNGHLQIRPKFESNLQKMIVDALNGVGGNVFIPSGPESKPYRLQAAPITNDHELARLVGVPVVTLLLADPNAPRPKDGFAAMAQVYGITPAENRVLMALSEGLSPKQIADTCNVSVNTVRAQMASLFNKTGTANQRELIRLTAQICAA